MTVMTGEQQPYNQFYTQGAKPLGVEPRSKPGRGDLSPKPDTSSLQILGILGIVIGLVCIALGSYVDAGWMFVGLASAVTGGVSLVGHMVVQALRR